MRWALGLAGLFTGLGIALGAAAADRPVLTVTMGETVNAPSGGRLLVFAEPIASALARANGGALRGVLARPFDGNAVAGLDVPRAAPGASLVIDLDQAAYPAGFSRLPPGEYAVQAMLDVDRNYNYTVRTPGDVISPVVRLRLPLEGAAPPIVLQTVTPTSDVWSPPRASARTLEALTALRPHAHPIAFDSPSLSAFWGRPVTMRGWVVTPPGYDARSKATYPTVYCFHGFSADPAKLVSLASDVYAAMAAGRTPPMIWVVLDHSGPSGTTEFADSANNGPWGRALTQDLIPDLERRYRMDARPSGRLLTGHSSGGWASLWLQVAHPRMFGGTWSTSPDPVDFHDFLGVDLYTTGANLYRTPAGAPRPMMRGEGKVLGTIEAFARQEAVLGPAGGQMASFEWVFSPRGPDGRPLPMFDRRTGAVDPEIIAYWRDHHDIAHRLAGADRATRRDLDGKIRVTVGDADSFYLDGAVRRLEGVTARIGLKARFSYAPGVDHFGLYAVGDRPNALLETYAWEMHAIARPGRRQAGSVAPTR